MSLTCLIPCCNHFCHRKGLFWMVIYRFSHITWFLITALLGSIGRNWIFVLFVSTVIYYFALNIRHTIIGIKAGLVSGCIYGLLGTDQSDVCSRTLNQLCSQLPNRHSTRILRRPQHSFEIWQCFPDDSMVILTADVKAPFTKWGPNKRICHSIHHRNSFNNHGSMCTANPLIQQYSLQVHLLDERYHSLDKPMDFISNYISI